MAPEATPPRAAWVVGTRHLYYLLAGNDDVGDFLQAHGCCLSVVETLNRDSPCVDARAGELLPS